MRLRICVLLVLGLSLALVSVSRAEMVKQGIRLRLIDKLDGFRPRSGGDAKAAGQGSEFRVVQVDESGKCFVDFKKVRPKAGGEYVLDDGVYVIDKKELTDATCEFGQGWYLGAITLPFKYHPRTSTSPDDLSTNLNISSALGRTIGTKAGITWTPMVFLGIENFALPDSTEVDKQLGLTWGAGLSFALTQAAQVGFVLGGDHITGSRGGAWPYQDKLWVSVSLGVKFLDI